jgi:hypothetical protein
MVKKEGNMKNIKFGFILLFTLLTISNSLAQSTFEGEIQMKVTSEEVMDLTFLIKGQTSKIVASSEQGPINIIFNQTSKKMYLVMHNQKMFMEFPLDEFEMKKGLDTLTDGEMNQVLNKTGRTRIISGYECDEYIVKDEDQTVNFWVSKEQIPFFGFGNPMGEDKKSKKYENLFSMLKGFPLEVISINNDGTQDMKMEVISINKKEIGINEFEIPRDYQKFEMPMMNFEQK